MIQGFDQIQKMTKDNMEAVAGNMGAVTKTAQSIALELADFSTKSFEEGIQALEKAMHAKSLDKFLEIQADYAKNAYGAYTGRLNKLGGLYMELAKDMYRPFEAGMAQFSK